MRPHSRDVWAIINAFDIGVLEKIKGRSLLDIAIGNVSGGKPTFGHIYVATDDETVANEAKRLEAELPRRIFIKKPGGTASLRESAFHSADVIVQDGAWRSYRRSIPKIIVSIDPFYPFTSFTTLEDIYVGATRCTFAIPVIDVVQGLVMPVWSIFGHRYSPPGTRPHENYEQFLCHTGGKPFTVEMVRVQSLSETSSCRDSRMLHNLNNITKNRSFRLVLDIGCETLYVPNGQTWGAYLPTDADFRYDVAHDVRIFRNGGQYEHNARSGIRREVVQQSDGEKARRRS
jgi:hypothetical protein